jgi:hypothetical protein
MGGNDRLCDSTDVEHCLTTDKKIQSCGDKKKKWDDIQVFRIRHAELQDILI